MDEDSKWKISAGSYYLNKWLFGGYERDIITVLYGGPGTGKTNFCVLAAVSQARKGKKVIFIDTEGGFSVERVRQIALGESEEVLKNILLLKPTSFAEQKKAFEELLKSLKDEVGLIVVDGMTILYRLAFAAAREENNLDPEHKGKSLSQSLQLHGSKSYEVEGFQKINSELAKQMRVLAEIARKRNIPVIVTNQVYRWEDAQRMVAGDILQYWGKCLIELSNERGTRKAYLRKHRSLPEKEMEFVILNEGVKKRGWL